jgi:hypothetical protein
MGEQLDMRLKPKPRYQSTTFDLAISQVDDPSYAAALGYAKARRAGRLAQLPDLDARISQE